MNAFSRLELAIGSESLEKLKQTSVAVLGIGGVGSYTVEALARSGVGRIILLDKDVVDITNMNRQIHALTTTIGESKVELMKQRILSINPSCEVITLPIFYNEDTAEKLFQYRLDYIVDAIDTLTSKIHVIVESKNRGIPIISSMGTANKLDPTKFEVTDISKTYMDPVARIVRQKLKKLGIHKGVKVVFSSEQPLEPKKELYEQVGKDSEIRKERIPPASNGFVPPVAGLIMASVVVRDIIGELD